MWDGVLDRPGRGSEAAQTLWLLMAVLALAGLSVLGPHSLAEAVDSLVALRRRAQQEMPGPPLIHAALLLQAVLIAIPFAPAWRWA